MEELVVTCETNTHTHNLLSPPQLGTTHLKRGVLCCTTVLERLSRFWPYSMDTIGHALNRARRISAGFKDLHYGLRHSHTSDTWYCARRSCGGLADRASAGCC
jgi:hypothetical protein